MITDQAHYAVRVLFSYLYHVLIPSSDNTPIVPIQIWLITRATYTTQKRRQYNSIRQYTCLVTMPTLQFAPFSSLVSPAFWHKLTDLKIDILKLSDEALPITGTYTAGKAIIDRETGNEVVLPTSFSVGGESFEVALAQRVGVSKVTPVTPGAEGGGVHHGASVTAVGSFKNFNTIEEFKALDKTKYFDEEAAKVRFWVFSSNAFTRTVLTNAGR